MGFRYIPEDMIRHSDFYDWYRSFPVGTQRSIEQPVDGLMKENPSYRLSPLTGPGYFMMHWLMGDLYTSLAIYLVRKEEGESPQALLERIDADLTKAGKKMNRTMQRLMKLPGAFSLARLVMPKAMTLVNGHGFQVKPVKYGRVGFGFDVTECPYCRLYAKYGVPELGPVLCKFDDTLGAGFDGLEFIRKGTLCRGDEKCDFLYRKKRKACR